MVIILLGIPAAGKSTIASILAERHGYRIVSRDTIRAAMFVPCSWTELEKRTAFDALGRALSANLQLGMPTIVEGMPFGRDGDIEAVEAIAAANHASSLSVLCACPIEVACVRAGIDVSEGRDIIDRGPATVLDVAARFRTLPAYVRVIDSSGTIGASVESIERMMNTF